MPLIRVVDEPTEVAAGFDAIDVECHLAAGPGLRVPYSQPVPKPVWSNTFERFETGTFPIVGPIAVDVYDWGHPQDGRPRMFPQGFLEWFTCAHPRSLLAAY